RRNRIVAGISDATLVIETARKGGSMITAELAYQYNRDLFAVPGRTSDAKSSGCLSLIKQNKALLYTDVPDLLETLGWAERKKINTKPRELFLSLSDEEQKILSLLDTNSTTSIDTLYLQSGLSSSQVANVLLNLEMQQVIQSMPGKLFKRL
ncbi:MAG: DNA-processing protein DprA, partial [Bacteroidota bacterium]|nr:DNA-processing protein DprA [Bacteroidota bacterium]